MFATISSSFHHQPLQHENALPCYHTCIHLLHLFARALWCRKCHPLVSSCAVENCTMFSVVMSLAQHASPHLKPRPLWAGHPKCQWIGWSGDEHFARKLWLVATKYKAFLKRVSLQPSLGKFWTCESNIPNPIACTSFLPPQVWHTEWRHLKSRPAHTMYVIFSISLLEEY